MDNMNHLLPTQRKFVAGITPGVELDVCLYQGGYGCGKTYIAAWLGIQLCKYNPGCKGLVGAMTWPMVRDTTLEMYFDILEAMGLQKGQDYTWSGSSQKLVFPKWGGSSILFRTLSEPRKLKSLTLGWVHLEEMSELTEDTFLMVLSRLRDPGMPQRRLMGTSNPEASKGWIHERFVKNNPGLHTYTHEGRPVQIEYRRLIAPSTENIHLPASYIANMAQQFDSEYYRMNVLGEDGDYRAGKVCKTWSPANIQTVPYRADQRLYLTCDFNVDPMCWALAHRVNGEYHFFDEIVMESTTVQECAIEFVRRYGRHTGGIVITGDASGNQRSDLSDCPNLTRYSRIQQIFSSYHVLQFWLDVLQRNPHVDARIEVWNAMVCNHNGVRRIKVDPKCQHIIQVCEGLRYNIGSSTIYRPTAGQIEKNPKLKYLRNDMFDAISYLVWKFDPKIDINLEKPRISTLRRTMPRFC